MKTKPFTNTVFEVETRVPGYFATPFLLSYSVENGKPVLEDVIYDSLVLSIPDLPAPVQEQINGAIQSNLEWQILHARVTFWENIKKLSEEPNLFGAGAKNKLDEITTLNGEGIRKTLRDMQKNISENENGMRQALGSSFAYFKNANFIFD